MSFKRVAGKRSRLACDSAHSLTSRDKCSRSHEPPMETARATFKVRDESQMRHKRKMLHDWLFVQHRFTCPWLKWPTIGGQLAPMCGSLKACGMFITYRDVYHLFIKRCLSLIALYDKQPNKDDFNIEQQTARLVRLESVFSIFRQQQMLLTESIWGKPNAGQQKKMSALRFERFRTGVHNTSRFQKFYAAVHM